ncbi:hypothetical protein FBUS_07079 [Fasciolopsis buskii]|uniref:Uncharacterized protein n=1 Tax=Fasciolopsis buskii TaxID=27845 RepID=A0A8E0VHT2_9TREM|nr:hypothetical protein FBUS_07079 [Fasciolopsis buski]
MGVTNEDELDLLFTFFITGADVIQTKDRPTRTGRPIRLVEPRETFTQEVEESGNTDTQPVFTISQPAEVEVLSTSEKDDESGLTSTDEAVAIEMGPDELIDVPELHSEPMGLVKRNSMGTPRATDCTADGAEHVKVITVIHQLTACDEYFTWISSLLLLGRKSHVTVLITFAS